MAKKPVQEEFVLAPGRAGKLIGWLAFGALVMVTLLMLLPNDDYYRWQQGDGTILFRARRVYERIHFDPRPLDVAMIGSSRIEASARAGELSAGLSKALGRPIAVENFGLPQEGRDLNWAVAKEVLETRRDVKLLVLILSSESVMSHPGFRFLGDDASIAGAPVFLNYDYAQNLLTLPYRHVAYFVQGLWPWAFQLSPRFDPAIYKARSFDPTKTFHMPYGTVIDRDHVLTAEEADKPIRPALPGAYFDSKIRYLPLDQRYAIERHYMRLIADLAARKHVAIAFLRVPEYHAGNEVFDDPGFYARMGPIVAASFVADHPDWYMDGGHLNRAGTAALTPWLVERLAPIVRDAEKGAEAKP